MVDLSVKFAGVDFKNPLTPAALAPAAPFTHWPAEKDAPEIVMKQYRKFYEMGMGAILTGTILWTDIPDAIGGSRFQFIGMAGRSQKLRDKGMFSAATAPDAVWSRTNGIELIKRCKREFGNEMKVVAGIIGPAVDSSAWADLAEECRQAGAVAVELSMISQMYGENYMEILEGIEKKKYPTVAGLSLGLVPEAMAKLIREMRERTSIPLIPKISPELAFFRFVSGIRLLKEAGVAALTCGHAFMGMAPPDIYNHGKTTFPYCNTTAFWCTQGPWIRFGCYRNVAAAVRYCPGLDIQACGGLVTPEHCIEAMMLGAKRVQLSSGLIYNGISFTKRVIDFMKKYMEEQGYKSVNDFIGLGQSYIVETGPMKAELREQIGNLVAQIDYDKCVGPDGCDICQDNWCYATYEEGGEVKIDPELCSSCTLCVHRCPHGARSMQWTKGKPAHMREKM